MNKEFVSYEQALALKELGFDEQCFGYYYTLNGKNWNFADKVEYCKLNDEMDIGGKFTISAPLYQQAFRWFREEHDLFGYTLPRANTKTQKLHFTNNIDARENVFYETHEEAEQACLDKLIEIIRATK